MAWENTQSRDTKRNKAECESARIQMATKKQLELLPYPKKKHHKEMAKTSNAPSSLEEKDQRSFGFFKIIFTIIFFWLFR